MMAISDAYTAPVLMAQLEAFAAVARVGNVSRAAEALHLTQPALTARLQVLEADLAVQLFVRGPRGMTLTDAGETLLPYAQRALAQVLDAREELAQDHLILFDRSSSYYELTSSLMRQAGVVPESVIELDNVEAAKKMVAEGLGVALLPRMALAAELRARTLRPVGLIGAPSVRRPIVAIRRRDAGPAIGPVAEFLGLLHRARGARA